MGIWKDYGSTGSRQKPQRYGSYGNKEDLITFQSKVSRKLAERFDVIRRLRRKTRREALEEFFMWTIEQHDKDKPLEQFFSDDEETEDRDRVTGSI